MAWSTVRTAVAVGACMLAAAGCSRRPVIADIGAIDLTNNVPFFHKIDRNKTCTIIPAILASNTVRLEITVRTIPFLGAVKTDWTRVDAKANRTNQISIGDNFDLRLLPHLNP